jgi:antitoxin component YwqK of YwqJK toxin-antitoxin module
MWSKWHRRQRLALSWLVLAALAAGLGFWWKAQRDARAARDSPRTVRELPLSQLTQRDGRLYASGESQPFDGRLIENFPNTEHFPTTVRKLEIEIHDGKAHGRSTGYFVNRKREVEENFIAGVSNGLRTRWDETGWKKSEERIEHGKLNGSHVEWHENGKKAVAMTLQDGQPEGLAEAWYPTGEIKSRTRFTAGKIVERQFFPDSTATARAADATESP